MTSIHTSIDIAKDYLHFGAAHFTLFSATERENLHGHNFFVAASMTCEVGDDGLAFDYNIIKQALAVLCDSLDEKLLLPEHSPHLAIKRSEQVIEVRFADEHMTYLPRDVLLLPVRNVTVEELAGWFLTQLRADPRITELPLTTLDIRVSSGPGQWAGAHWRA
ncbi:MAG: 6-carboxytetrahydropterin synthase [Pseudomonadales bacterium]|nr:6-carboxytetrahydropterin synthase [Pseudomonadales bacterium]MCP5184596.1 6-carboxytetrahydropterin synthase [Pseudomonadales bacterium]